MLRDASSLSSSDGALAKKVQNRSFPVIYMAHDRHYGRPRWKQALILELWSGLEIPFLFLAHDGRIVLELWFVVGSLHIQDLARKDIVVAVLLESLE
jgi:hypothetical protein